MKKSIKLHELTPDKVGLSAPEPKKPDIRIPFDRTPTREVALAQLRHAYKQLVSGQMIIKPKQFANLLTPAIIYLETMADDSERKTYRALIEKPRKGFVIEEDDIDPDLAEAEALVRKLQGK